MPIAPLITFKAGQCEVQVSRGASPLSPQSRLLRASEQTDSKPYRVIPKPEPGYLYLFTDDGKANPHSLPGQSSKAYSRQT